MELKEFAELRFKDLHEQLNEYNKNGASVEFVYQDALKVSGIGTSLSVNIGDLPIPTGTNFTYMTQGELVHIVNALRLIIDGYFKNYTHTLEINGYTKPQSWAASLAWRFNRWCERMKQLYGSTNVLCERIEDGFERSWEEYSDSYCYFALNKLLAEIERDLDEDDFKQEKDVENEKVYIFYNVPEFCWAFWTHQHEFIKQSTPYRLMLFSEDKHTKYISLDASIDKQVNVTFHETPHEIELDDVMNIVGLMRALMRASYADCAYGVDFNYRPYPIEMLSYIKDLLDHTPAKYVECVDKFEELEQDEDKYLYELYERAYLFLGKWYDYVEKWEKQRQAQHKDQHDTAESNSDNYYTDDKGQDMFAKFEALDDFREQTYALGFCYHNIEKYLVRAGRKTDDPTEDINKALDYLHEYRKLQKIYFE